MTTTAAHRQRRFLLSLLTLLTLVGAIGLGPTIDASASTHPAAQTRVRAIDYPAPVSVAAVDLGSSTPVEVSRVRLRQLVSATGVAENSADDLAAAEAAWDAAGLKPNGLPNRDSAAYVGITKDGEVAAGASRPGGIHAEDAANAQLPGGQMTKVMGWRRNPATGALEWIEIPVCTTCQGKYPPSQFPPDVEADPGGPWG